MAITKVIQITADTKEAQKALEEINLTLEQQEDLIKDTQRQIEKLEDLRDKTSKKDANRIREYNEEITKQNKNLKRTKTRLQENKAARSDVNKEMKTSIDSQRDYSGVLGLVDKQTGGAISGLQGMVQGITGATKGFKLMKVAIIATGIGALVIAITAVATALTNSEAGQNKFAKMMTQIGVVVGNVTDILGNFGNAIMSLVTGNFDDALESINKVTDGIKNFGEETKKEIKLAGELANKRAEADKLDRELLLERAEANRKFNELREKAADKENVSIEDRIAALREAGRIDEEITIKEIAAAKLRFEAKQLENSLSASTKEDLNEEIRLKAELINLETARLKKSKTLTAEITTNLREAEAERKGIVAKATAEQKIIDDEATKKAEEKKKIADKKITDDEVAAKKVIDDAAKTEKARLDSIKGIQDAFKAAEAERNAITEEEKAQLEADKAIADLDKLNATEEQKAKIVAYWNGKILEGRKKDTDAEENLTKQVSQAKVDIAKSSMALIGEIAGRGSKIGKAMAIGQATISGIEGVQNAYTTAQKSPITAVFPAYPFIQAGLAGVFSAIQIKKIASTKADGKGATPSPTVSGGGGAGAVPSLPPSFNTVGASSSNQLASAIGQQEQRPVQAYVVANDVTTAQGLERNIVEGATI